MDRIIVIALFFCTCVYAESISSYAVDNDSQLPENREVRSYRTMTGAADREKKATQDIKDMVAHLQDEILQEISSTTGKSMATMTGDVEAISFKTQVVAGTNYFIKIRVIPNDGYGRALIFHVRIYQGFDDNVELSGISGLKKNYQPIEYFD